MIGRSVTTLALAAIFATAVSVQGARPAAAHSRYVVVFPGYLYALPLPMSLPAAAPLSSLSR